MVRYLAVVGIGLGNAPGRLPFFLAGGCARQINSAVRDRHYDCVIGQSGFGLDCALNLVLQSSVVGTGGIHVALRHATGCACSRLARALASGSSPGLAGSLALRVARSTTALL